MEEDRTWPGLLENPEFSNLFWRKCRMLYKAGFREENDCTDLATMGDWRSDCHESDWDGRRPLWIRIADIVDAAMERSERGLSKKEIEEIKALQCEVAEISLTLPSLKDVFSFTPILEKIHSNGKVERLWTGKRTTS